MALFRYFASQPDGSVKEWRDTPMRDLPFPRSLPEFQRLFPE